MGVLGSENPKLWGIRVAAYADSLIPKQLI